MSSREVSFVILNYNGVALQILPDCLASVKKMVEQSGMDHEVIVVDNGSTDDSVSHIKTHFPAARILALPENRFVTSYNDGFSASTKEICIFLNNDMIVNPDFLEPLLAHFTNDQVFAVGPFILPWDKAEAPHFGIGRSTGRLRFGYIKTQEESYEQANRMGLLTKSSYSFHVAAGAYDKKKYLALGGLDPLFSPCYWEDTDLCFRAWRRGFTVIYEPKSVIHHKHQGTTSRVFKKRQLKAIMGKNRHFFMWKNIFSMRYLAQYFFFLPFRLFVPLLYGNAAPLIGFIRALKGIGPILAKRRDEKKAAKRRDWEIFSMIR
ncbi:MAG: glycosyltransferase family 2 protein [Nitrospirota bacterium]